MVVTVPDRRDRLIGTLLGTALGDALGLPAEGMSARAIARRFGTVERFRLLGRTGYVSDDTVQAVLIAQSILREPADPGRCARAFRRSLLAWSARLPFGVGLATVRACGRIAAGLRRTGVHSAGNGAAMRSAVVGVAFADDRPSRLAFGRALAETTHVDPRAVEGALYVAEVAAACARRGDDDRRGCVDEARPVVAHPELARAIDRARSLAEAGATVAEAATACGTSGFIVHTAAFATFCFLRPSADVLATLSAAIGAGGDTDSIAAILGGWLGALRGASAMPADLVGSIQDGPFGPTHLGSLGDALYRALRGEAAVVPRYSPALALARNLSLWPVILAHGFRRLVP